MIPIHIQSKSKQRTKKKEKDPTHSAKQLIQHPHPLISSRQHTLLYPNAPARNDAVEWPTGNQDNEPRKSTPSEESTFRLAA